MILICRFSETIPIAIGKFLAATSCSYLQQPSLSPAPHLPNSPSPKSRRPGGPEAVDAVVPAGSRWCCTSSIVTTLLCCPTESTGCPMCPTGVLIDPVAAVLLDLIGCWFPLRRLKLICSSPGLPGVKSACTLISRVDLDSADGVRAHNFWMYCTYYLLPTTYYLLPATYCTYYLLPNLIQLPTTFCTTVPTTYYLLPTTYYCTFSSFNRQTKTPIR